LVERIGLSTKANKAYSRCLAKARAFADQTASRSFVGQTLGWHAEGSGAGFIMSVLGVMLLLLIYRFTKRRSAEPL
jgi:hypothetical protein